MKAASPVHYDERNDIVEVFGIKYHMDMFRQMAFSPTNEAKWFRITKREDGVITVEVKKESSI